MKGAIRAIYVLGHYTGPRVRLDAFLVYVSYPYTRTQRIALLRAVRVAHVRSIVRAIVSMKTLTGEASIAARVAASLMLRSHERRGHAERVRGRVSGRIFGRVGELSVGQVGRRVGGRLARCVQFVCVHFCWPWVRERWQYYGIYERDARAIVASLLPGAARRLV